MVFFVVHYGDTDALLLNSNCQCKILLEKIKTICGINNDETIDIADMQAVVQKLCDFNHNAYASQVIQSRGNYILIKVIKRLDESGQFCKEYVPMLNELDTVNPDFITRLSNRKVNPDAYSKDMKENVSARLTSKQRKNESRSSGGKPKPSGVNLSANKDGAPPSRRTSQRH